MSAQTPSPSASTAAAPGQRIAVLGAGPMGLAVAYQLARDGHRPVVFEAADRVGGMTAMFDFDGLPIERYYHFHCTSDHAFLQMLDELGLSDKMRWRATRMGYWFQKRLQPWGNPVALLRFQGLGLVAKFRYGLHAFLSTKRTDWKPLDGEEATGWIRRWVGKEAYEVLWRRLFDYKFYDHAGNLSAAWIWSRIRRIGRSRYSLMREKLGHLDGGSATLLDGMVADIQRHGGEIRLSTPVTRVRMDATRVQGVETAQGFEAFDKVVSTIPLPYVPRTMPDLPPALLAQYGALQNIAVVCVIAKLRQPLTENFWLNVNDPDMDIPGLVEYSNLRPLAESVVYVPFYMPGEHPKFAEPDAAFLDKVRRYLKAINPKLQDSDFLALRASRYRYAQPICPPNYLDSLPPVQLPVRGLWVADTSYYYPEDRGISESIGFGRQMAAQAAAAQG
ncbi:NAD(P)/FAD-dependent oxidoreductase [Acidovorax sp. SUPP1855]|uniref:NAD(P)/FAD-dependent oxidoreductase n=1 Tax=Acidovorax sp. SUPP1855 TaxID=431774 RepID=UPI0023DE6760|nr:NAD(P)/FAD-dependent oxidoreductase [Acidovorax sp. SUPP1855]GKS83856.1 NAD(P)/FAD-dependent oxidoreductase [Acidovorax sp. SUPP1855]